MSEQFSRTEMLLGAENMQKLKNTHIAVFGVGGVGSYVAEGLARCGVYTLTLVDADVVSVSNINRQIHATVNTVGRPKVEVMRERILEINPEAQVYAIQKFILPETLTDVVNDGWDYIVDAIDTVTAKLTLVEVAMRSGTPIISSMGTGNKIHPEMLRIGDLSDTSVCPLARVMRHELRKRGIKRLKVCYSTEQPIVPVKPAEQEADAGSARRSVPGSVSFVPSSAGLMIAGEVVRDVLELANGARS